ncbi:MAG: RES domain-containing protein [Nocardioidaceae bacterium]|nr:RES domain-containing protein [Nocardioidaceae bacterium]
MELWRVCAWTPATSEPTINGHPLFVRPMQGAGRVDDPEGEYLVLYAGDSPEGAVAEYLGNYPRWTAAVLSTPPASPAGSALALVRLTGDVEVLDLDDPHVLVDQGLRPSSVVTRERVVTQQWARAIFEAGGHAGVTWWSYRDPRWASYGLWDRRGLALADQPEPLTLTHPAVITAGQVISRVIET